MKSFLNSLRTPKTLGTSWATLYQRGVESMLKGEIEAHLGYSKNAIKPESTNSRNGYGSKRIKTNHGELDIKVPRDRNADFEPQIVPKPSRLSEGIESLIVSLYAKGMSNFDIEEQLIELYGFNVSTSTISIVTDKITGDILLGKTGY
jgi:transposase-like protein